MDRAVSFQRSMSKKLSRKRSQKHAPEQQAVQQQQVLVPVQPQIVEQEEECNNETRAVAAEQHPVRSLIPQMLRPKPKSVQRLVKVDDVRDGKFFHIRVTVGYLTSLKTAYVSPEASKTSDIVSVYVSFGSCGEYDFATSLPLLPHKPRQTVKWPKGDAGVKTSKRRLYHSILLRTTPGNMSTSDELLEQTKIPIHVGVQRGDAISLLGMASLCVTGKEFKARKMDLPLVAEKPRMKPTPPPNPVIRLSVSSEEQKSNKRAPSKLKTMFKSPKKSSQPTSPTINSRPPLPPSTKQETFDGHDKIYLVDQKHSYLRIKLDVQEGVYDQNGPGLWGDLEDDEESFGPISVIDIPDDGRGELTNRYAHESIEVISLQQQGTTIISSPGVGEAQEDADDEDLNLYRYYHQRQQASRQANSNTPTTGVPPPPKEDRIVLSRDNSALYQFSPAIALCGAAVGRQHEDEETLDSSERDPAVPSHVAPRVPRGAGQSVQDSQLSYSLGSASTGSGSTGSDEDEDDYDDEDEEDFDEEDVSEATSQSVEEEEALNAADSLIKYASRLGVPVEELLEDYEEESIESSSYDSNTRKSSLSGTNNEWQRM